MVLQERTVLGEDAVEVRPRRHPEFAVEPERRDDPAAIPAHVSELVATMRAALDAPA